MAMIQYQVFFHFDNGYAQQLVNIKLLICVYIHDTLDSQKARCETNVL